jgi:iron complex transport system substrate-binding protein
MLLGLLLFAGGIVSLDHCADQYVLRYADRTEIAALSPGAGGDYAFLREEAEGLPKTRPDAEAILDLRPATVVRSYGGDRRLLAFLERQGIEVVEIGWAATLDQVAQTQARVAGALGNPGRGETAARAFREKIAPSSAPERTILYLTPSGVTTGPGSLVHEVIEAAGFRNFETRPGWHDIPLERLATETPDLVLRGFFDSERRFEGARSPMRHPLAGELLDGVPIIDLPGAYLACAAWPLGDAVEALRKAGPS